MVIGSEELVRLLEALVPATSALFTPKVLVSGVKEFPVLKSPSPPLPTAIV